MAKSSPPPVERGFTLIELIVVLASHRHLMSPCGPGSTKRISERAKATKDMSNLHQIGIATQTYMNDNDGILPWYQRPAPWYGTTSTRCIYQKYIATQESFPVAF